MREVQEAKRTSLENKHNRLAHEKSPYLLQHAHNPVDWYPWGEEAFEAARGEDKPIFLSIGYSSCHWCHVMEHESFDDPQVAKLMNAAFVNIKVDREERPDIDDVYMMVAQMMTGRGGWPLTIIMTPDKVPFFAATYVPKQSRWGQVGMLTLIPAIQERWEHQRAELLNVAEEVTGALRQVSQDTAGEELSQATLERAFQQLSLRFDEQNGGFGNAPKFPMPHNLLFLLRYWKRTAGDRALQMVEQTLLSMRRGGVFDHVGLGFHRYSTDDHWLLPHFEKMLYDQAMLAMAYAEAYQATGKDAYRQTAEEIFAYVLRDMTAPEGGFYSAEDADSEGVEGKFYVWTQSELRRVLGEEDAKLVAKVFGVEAGGNYVDEATREKTGNNILHLEEPLSQLALAMGVTEQEIEQRIEAARGKLFAYREQRVHPLKDDKVLTDWNGLMIAALAKGARAFDAPRYADAAAAAASFILERMVTKDRRLLHRYRDGEAALPAYAADYAFLTWGLLELYEATFEVRFLEQALALNADMIAHFWDGARGGFYSTADDSEELLVRQKEIYDGAIPSANSVAMLNLLRLGRMTAAPDLEEKAAMIGRAFSRNVASSPAAYTQLMVAVDFGLGPSYEVVVAGEPGAEDVSAMLGALRAGFIPSKVVLFRPDGESPAISRLADFTRYQASVDGKATAYVCRSHNCEFPTTDADAMLDLLGVSKR
ncbi:MAG: thioredoxin [Anaerolineae bacterium SM23_84]|nr:MAG: thioredoxin [Anaerolineae bacterium SM23_84]